MADVLEFQCSTRRTGLLRVVKVLIFDDEADFLTAYHRHGKRAGLITEYPEGYRIDASCVGRREWEDRDPRPHQVTMLFVGERLDATTIAHEATHAAMHIYSIDSYRNHSRATAHLNVFNETVPYLAGDIFSKVCVRVIATGRELTIGAPGGDWRR